MPLHPWKGGIRQKTGVHEKSLRVCVALDFDDADTSVVMLRKNVMMQLGLSDNGYVVLKSDYRETVCRAVGKYCLCDQVRLSSVVSRNLDVNDSDYISVSAAPDIDVGIQVDVAPFEDFAKTVSRDMLQTILTSYLTKNKRRPVHEGDLIMIGADLPLVKTIEYKVIKTDPSPVCLVGPNTEILLCAQDFSCETTSPENEVVDDNSRSAHQLAECPVCLEEYHSNKKPMVLLCGHSVCENCLDGCSRCSICRSTIFEVSLPNGKKLKAIVGYEILQLNKCLQEMSTKKEDVQEGGELACNNCQSVEKAEKMRICETCLEADGLNRNVEEEMVTPYILCTVCFADNHNGHKLFKYLPWKIQGMARESSRNGIENVVGMKELCDAEAIKGNEEYDRWMKEMKAFTQFEASTMKFEEALLLRNQLNEESEVVCKAADDTLLPLRSFTQKVKESADRLRELRKLHEKEKTHSDTICVSFGEPYKCSGSKY